MCHWCALTRLSFKAWHLALRAVLLSSVLTSLPCISYMLCSRFARRASPGSSIGSAGVPGWDTLGLCGVGPENESRWIRVCLDALLLISRSPFRSPLLKLPLPCLNCHRADSGCPLWKTSLTDGSSALCTHWKRFPRMLLTFVKAIHIQLPHEGRNVGVLKILPVPDQSYPCSQDGQGNNVRKHFRKLGRGGHEEALSIRRPGYEPLYCRVLQHAVPLSASALYDALEGYTCIACG